MTDERRGSRPKGARRFAVAAAVAAVLTILAWSSIRLADGARQTEYFSLLARVPEFLAGGLLALRPVGKTWSATTFST